MPNRCVVFGCNNYSGCGEHISVFRFPQDLVVRKKWVDFVKEKRRKWADHQSPSVVICSMHFDDSCFDMR